MKREELTNPLFYMNLMYVYNVYEQFQKKYNTNEDSKVQFNFYNYNDSGYDIEMSNTGFYVWEAGSKHDDNFLFCIYKYPEDEWSKFFCESLIDDCSFIFNKQIDSKIYIFDDVGPNVSESTDIDEFGFSYTEEWFFQYSTLHNIIEFEQFEKEFNLLKKLHSSHISKNVVIKIDYLSDFKLEMLNAFEVLY